MIDTEKINPLIKQKLYDCGWSENIQYDITETAAALQREGYQIFDYAEEILRSFLNTEIIFSLDELKTLHAKRSKCYGDVRFNVMDTASGMFDCYGAYHIFVNEKVYPIGFINDCIGLLAGESGRIYADTMPCPKVLGTDIIDFFNHILQFRFYMKIFS
ncbi:MAG: SUKH-3 domain-containing protein [Ruminococcus sp.]|nr:SUKH-3 domain-containing protein [Ruminococcus sp.]